MLRPLDLSWIGDSTTTMEAYGVAEVCCTKNFKCIFGALGMSESWVHVGYGADQPVCWTLPFRWVMPTLHFAVYTLQEQYSGGCHVLVSDAEWASSGFSGFRSGFGEVCGSFAAFLGDDDPAVKKIILTKFIIGHKLSACTSFVAVFLF